MTYTRSTTNHGIGGELEASPFYFIHCTKLVEYHQKSQLSQSCEVFQPQVLPFPSRGHFSPATDPG